LDGVHLVCSDDHGTNWYIGAVREHVGNGRRPTENQVVERVGLSATNSRLYCNARDSGTALGNRSDNYSNDGGLSYGPSFNALNPALVEPGCQGSVQRQRATDEGAAYDAIVLSLPNHDYVGSDAASRWNMSIWYSVDEGGSWSDPISIYPGSTGYSDMTRFPNGDIGLLYEADYYSKINFTLVTPASLGLPANANQTATWDGGGGAGTTWGTAANLDGNVLPAYDGSLDLVFYKSGSSYLSHPLGADRMVRSLVFNADADSNFSIQLSDTASTSKTLTLRNFVPGASAAITVSNGAAGDFTIGSGYGSVTLRSPLVVTHNGSGVLTLDRPLNESGGEGGAAKRLTKNGTGTLKLTGANTFSGLVTVSAGTLEFKTIAKGPASSLGTGLGSSPNGRITIAGGDLKFTGSMAQTVDRNIAWEAGATGALDASGAAGAALVINDTAQNPWSNPGVRTLSFGGTNADANTYSGALANQSGSVSSLTKKGSGKWVLTGANTYTGATTISGGTLQVGGWGALNGVSITNAGFETPTTASYTYTPAGGSWTFDSQSGICKSTFNPIAPPVGLQCAFLQSAGTISQATEVGTEGNYTIRFQAIGRSGSFGPNGVMVLVDGVAVGTWPHTAVSQSQWLTYSTNVNLTAGSHTLSFAVNNTAGGDKSVCLDEVQMFQTGIVGSLGNSAVTVQTGATLSGLGSIAGSVNVQAGGTLSPGPSTGTLSISNSLALAGTTFVEVNASNGQCDLVQGVTSITYGGSLVLSNLSGTLTNGQTFQLFSASGTKTGNFSSVTPALTGGKLWNFNRTNGVLSVVTTPANYPTNLSFSVSNGTLSLTWPVTHLGWFAQSNIVSLASPSNWFDIPASSNATSLNVSPNPGRTNVFYRLRAP